MENSPIKRTLARLRKLGYHAGIVERRLPRCFITRDLFGIADVLAVHPGERTVLLVQATTAAHLADRLRRVRGQPDLPALLAAGVRVEVWGWARRGGRWHVRRVAVRPGDLAAVTVAELPRRRRGDEGAGNRSALVQLVSQPPGGGAVQGDPPSAKGRNAEGEATGPPAQPPDTP